MADFTAQLKSRVSALAENARDVTLDFEAASGSRFFDNDDQTMKEVQTLLAGRLDREKLEALRRLVALMSRGTDVSSYFASVIQLIASPNLEIKKLVYIYLLRYAESNPDLALMSINTIQKSLSDKNQIVRAMALRVMSGIRVPLISGLVIIGIQRSVTDLSFFVRKTAAIAIIKGYEYANFWYAANSSLDPGLKRDLLPSLQVLLEDRVPAVISRALAAWEHVCPQRTDLLHRPYRNICRLLVEMDEWGQLVALRVLTIYVRRCFSKPTESETQQTNAESFYEEGVENTSSFDPDLLLLYKFAMQLVHSRSSAVIIALVRLFQDIAPSSYLLRVIPSLIRLSRTRSPSTLYPVLCTVAVIAAQNPAFFSPHAKEFFVKPTDPPHIALLKLDILVSSATEESLLPILIELDHYSKSGDAKVVGGALRGVARCAMKCMTERAVDKCAGILGRGIRSRNDAVSTPSTLALRTLIQLNPKVYAKYIHLLAQSLPEIHSSPAKAEIIWLVGEYASQLNNRAPDVLRLALQDFSDQDDEVKYQIVTLAAKVYALYFPDGPLDIDTLDPRLKQIHLLYTYTISLARYDMSYDIRDRARLLKNLHLSPLRAEALHTPKPVPHMQSFGERAAEWRLGSLAQVIVRETQGDTLLPEWGSEIPEKGVRDVPEPTASAPAASSAGVATPPAAVGGREEKRKEKKAWKDLDKFYASESESDEEEEVEESEDEEDEEEEEVEEEEDEESEEEEESESGDETSQLRQDTRAWR